MFCSQFDTNFASVPWTNMFGNSLKVCSNVTLCQFSSNVLVNYHYKCVELLLNIFTVLTDANAVTQHLQCIPNITTFETNWPQHSKSLITSSINSLSVNEIISLIKFLFAQMISSAVVRGW